ncbi:MAG: hypothetical protein H6669_14940 [Ardenticatenaceae bacterium]|nr:hypothetical protein [Ardenticatenaceae bacterium]
MLALPLFCGRAKTSGNLLVGRFWAELAIPAEMRRSAKHGTSHCAQMIRPALAVAADNVLVGEELFAASAYLENKPGQIASLKVQDIMRWLVIITILLLALSQVLAG